MLNNASIAAVLDEMADLLEITGANLFRVRAYRNAARAIHDLPEPVESLLADSDRKLIDIPGIGKDLAEKVVALATTGDLAQRQELLAKVPAGVRMMLRIPGLGPKKAAVLLDKLHVTNLDELRAACESQQVRELKGFGQKTEEIILRGLAQAEQVGQRLLWADADIVAQSLLAHLRQAPGVAELQPAGSYRRGRDTIGDLDLLVVATQPGPVMDRLAAYPDLTEVLARGETKMSIRLGTGLQVDLRVVAEPSFGAAWQYFTGSKQHNVILRGLAKERGLKINEYGVFRDEAYVAGRTEEEVYATLDLPWFPPELREGRDEFEWALTTGLPELVELADLQGDLHMHTDATDGKASLEQMCDAARARGYQYIAITDHSKRVSMANGLDGPRLRQQWAAIDRLNARQRGFRVLKGVEVDILERGGLDLPDDVLAEADWVVASVHYGQNQPSQQITRRITDALANPHVSAIAHPTGRLLGRREAYEVDLAQVIRAAAEHGKFLELNANPNRLDLDDVACAAAKRAGVPITISSDAHSVEGLAVERYGILQARRAGLTAADVVNTRPWAEIAKRLARRG